MKSPDRPEEKTTTVDDFVLVPVPAKSVIAVYQFLSNLMQGVVPAPPDGEWEWRARRRDSAREARYRCLAAMTPKELKAYHDKVKARTKAYQTRVRAAGGKR